MPKPAKNLFLIVVVVVMWGLLASIDAGPAGFGVILSLLALFDVVTGEFSGNNKLTWLIVSLAGLAFAAAAIGSVMLQTPAAEGNKALYPLATAIALILPVAYFLFGRRQKVARTE